MNKKQIEIPKKILDIADPTAKRRAIYELAKKARMDLTLPHQLTHDTSKRTVVVEQE